MQEFEFKTQPREYKYGYLVAEVSYKLYGGNRAPYLSITASGYGPHFQRGEPKITIDGKSYWLDCCGCQHDEVKLVFPELAPFIRWHLSDPTGPVHYVENAVYWMQGVYGVDRYRRPDETPQDHAKNFKSQVVFGAVEGDEMPHVVTQNDDGGPTNAEEMRELIRSIVVPWCEKRLPALQAAFKRDLEAVYALKGKL